MKEIKGSYNLTKTGDTWGMEKTTSLVDEQLEDVFISMLVESRAKELGLSIEKYCECILETATETPLNFN